MNDQPHEVNLVAVQTPAGEELVGEAELCEKTGVYSEADLEILRALSDPHRHITIQMPKVEVP